MCNCVLLVQPWATSGALLNCILSAGLIRLQLQSNISLLWFFTSFAENQVPTKKFIFSFFLLFATKTIDALNAFVMSHSSSPSSLTLTHTLALSLFSHTLSHTYTRASSKTCFSCCFSIDSHQQQNVKWDVFLRNNFASKTLSWVLFEECWSSSSNSSSQSSILLSFLVLFHEDPLHSIGLVQLLWSAAGAGCEVFKNSPPMISNEDWILNSDQKIWHNPVWSKIFAEYWLKCLQWVVGAIPIDHNNFMSHWFHSQSKICSWNFSLQDPLWNFAPANKQL